MIKLIDHLCPPQVSHMKKRKIICIIKGGGRGSRLSPLTKERCKPAVPLAGKYRLVDIPISNCLNAGMNQIYVFERNLIPRHCIATFKSRINSIPLVVAVWIFYLQSKPIRVTVGIKVPADAVRQNMNHFDGTGRTICM